MSVSLFRFIVGIFLPACVFVCVFFATAADVHVDWKLKHKQSVNKTSWREVTQKDRQANKDREECICVSSRLFSTIIT